MRAIYLTLALSFILVIGKTQQKSDGGGQNPILTDAKQNTNWYDVQKQSSPILQGVGWNEELKGTFGRLPLRAKAKVRPDVWGLSENCAGITIRFKTNASEIKVIYQVSGPQVFPHMPNTGISGLDLYTSDSQGKAVWSSGAYSFGDTIKYTFKNLTSFTSDPTNREYQLFLPLYNHVKWMEIGVPKEAELTWMTPSTQKPLVVYGTSIAQGGCASRPGMAWTGILNRELPYPLLNLAFSGNGLLEKEVLDFINELDAKLYILDCLPNLVGRSAKEIENATRQAVHQIRTLHKAPILLVEHPGYNDGFVDKKKLESYTKANQASKAAFEKLKADGIHDLYYLSYEEINMPMDGTVDGIHSTDYGMRAYADAYEKKIRKILHTPKKLKK